MDSAYQTARNIGVMNVDEIRDLEQREPIPVAKDPDDYDGTDYTPLQIQVAAARGIKEIIGEGQQGDTTDGGVEDNPQNVAKPPFGAAACTCARWHAAPDPGCERAWRTGPKLITPLRSVSARKATSTAGSSSAPVASVRRYFTRSTATGL